MPRFIYPFIVDQHLGCFHFLVIAINICVQIFLDIFSFVSFLFLRVYQIQELNVRKVTLSTDKNKYGIRLRAEPDHMVLGKRLKGAFKMVMTSIKQLSNEELERFQENGGCLFHWGHHLCPQPDGYLILSLLFHFYCYRLPLNQNFFSCS